MKKEPSREKDARHHAPGTASEAWQSSLLTSTEIERLVDRLSVTLQAQSQTVRELEAARAELDARQIELEAARAKAERASETLATFLKALGHDLRAPLVSVDAALQMLDLEMRDGDLIAATDRIAEVRRTASHGLALIDDLFELIRSDAGQWRVDPQAVRIDEIVADARAVIAPKAAHKRIGVETRWVGSATDPRQFVETDPVRVRQALVNLLSNAVKFSDHGTVVLEIERRRGDMLAFRVIDSGPGIENESIDAIFEPFVQAKRTARHAKDGAGLGLAIVRRCARLLGGDATAANRPSGGAVFTFEVRAPVTEPPADAMFTETVEPAAPARTTGKSLGPSVDKVVERMAERVAERVAERLDVRVDAVIPGVMKHPAKQDFRPSAPAPEVAPPADTFGAMFRGPGGTTRRNAEEPAAPRNSKPASKSRAAHALVVDGSAEHSKQIASHLRKLGLETSVAHTLAEARQLISQSRPDLIVSDRKLPDGSGLEFHDIAPGTRLVLSSTNPDPNEFPPGTRILAKPATARAVQEIVLVSLNRRVVFPT